MHDLIVIGAGPAGLGAALQAAHTGGDVLVLERDRIGGRLNLAREVGNFPWHAAGRPAGAAIARQLWRQARRSGVRVAKEECRRIGRTGRCFEVLTAASRYRGRSLIIATGTRPRPIGVPLAPAVAGLVHYRWINIPVRRGMLVAVIGAGEVAFDQACSLAEHGAAVTVLCRSGAPRAFARLVAQSRGLGVRVLLGRTVSRIESAENGGVALVTPRGRVRAGSVLIAIGSEPSFPPTTPAARRLLGRGMFVAGDAVAGHRRQAAIAYGDGVNAAIMAMETIEGD